MHESDHDRLTHIERTLDKILAAVLAHATAAANIDKNVQRIVDFLYMPPPPPPDPVVGIGVEVHPPTDRPVDAPPG